MTPAERRKLTSVTGRYPSDGDEQGKPRPESYTLTVPKWWCRKHGFPKEVFVTEMMDGALRVEAVKE